MQLIQFAVNECNRLGSSIGFGTFEGFIIYASILTYAYLKLKEEVSK